MVGQVKAGGLTARDVENNIRTALADGYLNDPRVAVEITTYRPFYIVGEVQKPGEYQFRPGMTVLQAISSAGGLTPYANKKKIYILRGDPGKQQKVPFNYKKAVNGDMPGITLQPGDTVVVP